MHWFSGSRIIFPMQGDACDRELLKMLAGRKNEPEGPGHGLVVSRVPSVTPLCFFYSCCTNVGCWTKAGTWCSSFRHATRVPSLHVQSIFRSR